MPANRPSAKRPDPDGSVAASELGRFVTCERAWFYDKYGSPRPATPEAAARSTTDRAKRDDRFARGRDAHVASARGEQHRRLGLYVALGLLALAGAAWLVLAP